MRFERHNMGIRVQHTVKIYLLTKINYHFPLLKYYNAGIIDKFIPITMQQCPTHVI